MSKPTFGNEDACECDDGNCAPSNEKGLQLVGSNVGDVSMEQSAAVFPYFQRAGQGTYGIVSP